jgi:hypothetical protein
MNELGNSNADRREDAYADHLRHLVADTSRKMDSEDELDRGYIMEDLLRRLLEMAEDLSLSTAVDELEVYRTGPAAYPLEPRASFGELEGTRFLRECPYTHAHTRSWCGFPTCRES